ncbi:Crp/Fnr family transcriptional regulator [Plantactinospora sp. S1510]|uniref:Crp/Fnr family transcriptional regulator n=1 Tax=Plantactinospora alkalitolerans TaxID=2789879 RepID=A0ABS0GYE2_9ACTN|nr:Crp/Fnr family transcriptional regulator [Plantactinospora alkalitolerans]MBF9131212.1 Crp/Fnr family transcriptional regulator [Plantactinospora alkalitolerans]
MAYVNLDSAGTLHTDEEWSSLEKIGTVIHYPVGSILVGEGEATDFVLLIRTGHVKVVSGAPRRIVGIRRPGEMVGEMASIRMKPRSASVFALSDVEALFLSADSWKTFLLEHPRAVLAQLYATEERLAEATQKSVESLLGAERKLAKAILELDARGLGVVTESGTLLRFSQQDLADIAGVSLDSAKQVIRAMKRGNAVHTGRQAITIVDRLVLQDIASARTTSLGERVPRPDDRPDAGTS